MWDVSATRIGLAVAILVVLLGGLAASVSTAGAPPPVHPPSSAPAEAPRPTPDRADAPTASARARGEAPAVVEIAYRIEVRTTDAATAGAAGLVHAVLTDPRGWVRAGYRFVLDPAAAYAVVIAEGPEVDALCHPYEMWGTYSCQNGPVVALNADRWREATPQWPADLERYRTMLVNHEVGHLLHLHHPDPQCPGPGLPAPVMAQQSTELGDCVAHPWPLQWEIDLAAQRREPLAPTADHDPSDHRPVPPPASS
ncbi:MAG: DUF3152 domain-containing protein [Egibacteraceae bacterium]